MIVDGTFEHPKHLFKLMSKNMLCGHLHKAMIYCISSLFVAAEETKPYGLKSEEVSEVCHAEMIVAADGMYTIKRRDHESPEPSV